MKTKVKRYLLAALVVIVLSGSAYALTRPQEIELVAIEPKNIKTYFVEDGNAKSVEDYHIYANVSGKVVQVYAEKGQYVEAGTVIAEIDPKDYLIQLETKKNTILGYEAQIAGAAQEERDAKDTYRASIAQLNAKLTQAENEITLSDINGLAVLLPEEQLRILDLSIEQCQIELDYQQDQFEKDEILYQAGAIARVVFEGSKQSYQAVQNRMDQHLQQKDSYEKELSRIGGLYGDSASVNALNNQAKNGINQGVIDEIKAQIAAMELDLTKDYQGTTVNYYGALIANEEAATENINSLINDCVIIAGRSGFITDIPAAAMSNITPQALVCSIKEHGEVLVESYVSTSDIVHIALGDTVDLIQKTREEDIAYTGVITDIAPWAEERVSPLGVIEYKVKVTIDPVEAVETVKSGYNLDVKYYTFDGKDCIVLPNSAFYRADGIDYVFIVETDKNRGVLRGVQVTKGPATTSETVVYGGLQFGDSVAKSASADGVAEGIVVRID